MNLRAVLKKPESIFFNAKEWLMNPVVLTSSFGAVISSLVDPFDSRGVAGM